MQKIIEKKEVTSSAPCRIDMAGTLDLKTFYYPLRHWNPCTFNIAIGLRTKVRLSPYKDGVVKVSSKGVGSAEYPVKEARFDGRLGLMFAIAAYFNAEGVHIDIESFSPPRSGLGGSSAASVALIGAFYKALDIAVSRKEIARLAHDIEEGVAQVSCGMQDQLAAVYGGVNAWRWTGTADLYPYIREKIEDKNLQKELERSIIIAYSGSIHKSKDINSKWMKTFLAGQNRDLWIETSNCANKFVEAIFKNNIDSAVKWMKKDKKFLKKKISFRKKAVVEGSDLYDSRNKGRKGRGRGRVAAKQVKHGKKTQITTAKQIKRRIKIGDTIILAELAKRIGIKANEMIKKLMGMGVMATVNQTIDFDTAALLATEFNYELERADFEEETILKQQESDPTKLEERPPVVTIMGHVDHGKTSLLDAIRKTSVADDEAGKITQHIGAYHVSTERGRIVFLDTPGHEAFTAMRSRGASITDIVVLVVAADDGVMPQTIEAINHSKVAKVPMIVAINKIDKPGSEPSRVKRELAELGLTSEEWGGETIFVEVSAKQKKGISSLLEMILLQAEVMELKADPNRQAVGRVIEAKLDSGKGPEATVLVQTGTLNRQDYIVCGLHYGKLRILLDDRGRELESAGPSMPVKIIGLSGVPVAGDELIAIENEKDAKQISEHRIQKERSKELAKKTRMTLENLFEKMQKGEARDLNLVIKADVQGSIEALKDSLIKLSNNEVKINVVHAATGAITETDLSLAEVAGAIIVGFNVRPNAKVQNMAKEANVDIHFYNVIYNVIKDVQDAILGMMSSTFEERVIGRAEARQLFNIPKVGTIAGTYVTDGKIVRNGLVRLVRDGIVIYDGKIDSLRRFKDDAKEVLSGYECGIGIEKYNDLKIGDIIECYYLEEVKPKI